MEREQQLANIISDVLNPFGFSPSKFCEAMGKQHRYLQGVFTTLCIAWIDYASKQYKQGNYDARNEHECRTAKVIIDHLSEHLINS